MPLKRAFGQVLHDMRIRRGLTPQEFAAIVAVSEQVVAQWEAGEEAPAPAEMEAIAALFRQREPLRPPADGELPSFDDDAGPPAPPAPPGGRVPDA